MPIEFIGIDLQDSSVLSWKSPANVFKLTVEASVWPQSTFYSATELNQYTRYKRAVLEFRNTTKIKGLIEQRIIQPTLDSDDSVDCASIDSLVYTDVGDVLEGSQLFNVRLK